jgi:hypothetical protein
MRRSGEEAAPEFTATLQDMLGLMPGNLIIQLRKLDMSRPRSRSVLPRGLGRGEGQQGGGGPHRILKYGRMTETGQHFDPRARNRAIVRGGSGSPGRRL